MDMKKIVKSFQLAEIPEIQRTTAEGLFDPKKTYGYALINDLIVPYSFIDRVREKVLETVFVYDEIFSMSEIFDRSFIESLSEVERSVLPSCMMFLIEDGYFGIWDEDYPPRTSDFSQSDAASSV